jgi:predicted DNA-binding transcriptional regulator AlpA
MADQKFYQFKELKPAGVPYTRKHITHLEKQEDFPKHVQLGPQSVAWIAVEVDRWVQDRIDARDRPQPDGPKRRPGPGRPRKNPLPPLARPGRPPQTSAPVEAPVSLAARR